MRHGFVRMIDRVMLVQRLIRKPPIEFERQPVTMTLESSLVSKAHTIAFEPVCADPIIERRTRDALSGG